jgi:membrane protease YdiL (CAAX protease family)
VGQALRATPFEWAVLSLALAASLWVLVFIVRPLEFWLMLSLSTIVLLLVALAINRRKKSVRINSRLVLLGVVSGVLLYFLFYFGFQATKSNPIFSEGVGRVYELRTVPTYLIALALVFPIGPGEEIYWRGLIQRRFSERLGPSTGLLAASCAYALVHLPTLDLPLIMTAFIGGLVWGYIYKRTGSLLPVIVSHVLFDLLIFVIAPLA